MTTHTFVGPYGSTLRYNGGKRGKGRWEAKPAFATAKITVVPVTHDDGTADFDVSVECAPIESMHPYTAREIALDNARAVEEAGLFDEIIGTVDMTVNVSWGGPDGPDADISLTDDNLLNIPGAKRPLTPDEVRSYAGDLEIAADHAAAMQRGDVEHFIDEAQSYIDQWDLRMSDVPSEFKRRGRERSR